MELDSKVNKIILVFFMSIVLIGCSHENGRPYKDLKISDIKTITIEDENSVFMPETIKGIEKLNFINYLNDLDLSNFKKIDKDMEGSGKKIILEQIDSSFEIRVLKPYLVIDSFWYECPDDEEIFEMLKSYNQYKAKPFNDLEISDIKLITIKHGNPNIDDQRMRKEDIDEFVECIKDLDFSNFEIIDEIPVGCGLDVYIDSEEDYILHILNPYLGYGGNLYKYNEDEKLFEILNRYEIHDESE